jgi:hypothetical protein
MGTMAKNRGKKLDRLPPYLTYSTWLKLSEAVEEYLPPQFDKSYWDSLKFSGSTRTTVKGTLVFLELIDSDNKPTDRLQRLVDCKEIERRAELKTIIQEAYKPVLGELNLARATVGQLEQCFRDCGAKGNIGDKCVSFFLALAKDAGIALSPHLEAKSRLGRAPKTSITRERSKRPKAEMPQEPEPPEVPQSAKGVPWTELLEELLLQDFPDFDHSWSEDVKIKWLVRELIRRASSKK